MRLAKCSQERRAPRTEPLRGVFHSIFRGSVVDWTIQNTRCLIPINMRPIIGFRTWNIAQTDHLEPRPCNPASATLGRGHVQAAQVIENPQRNRGSLYIQPERFRRNSSISKANRGPPFSPP